MTIFDRDAAREVLRKVEVPAWGALERVLDELAGCVRPVPPQVIDRDALEEAWDEGNASGLDGWVGPGRGAGDIDREAVYARGRDVDRILTRVTAVVRQMPPQVIDGGQVKQVWAVYCADCNTWLSEWNSDMTEAEVILREHQNELHD